MTCQWIKMFRNIQQMLKTKTNAHQSESLVPSDSKCVQRQTAHSHSLDKSPAQNSKDCKWNNSWGGGPCELLQLPPPRSSWTSSPAWGGTRQKARDNPRVMPLRTLRSPGHTSLRKQAKDPTRDTWDLLIVFLWQQPHLLSHSYNVLCSVLFDNESSLSSNIHLSILPFGHLLFSKSQEAGVYLHQSLRERRVHPGQVTCLSQGHQATNQTKQPFRLSLTPEDNLVT